MTKEELKTFDGKNGRPAYIAYKNKIYDVTSSRLWKNGLHANKHFAGNDLTEFLSMAPHGENVFDSFEQVGELEDTPTPKAASDDTNLERARKLYAKYHPHPMLVHFPIALHYFSGFIDLLFIPNPTSGYETTVFLSFLIATVMGLFALASGILSWWINYAFIWSKAFVIKLTGALVTLVLGMVAVTQKIYNPLVAYDGGMDGFIYHFIIFFTVASVSIVGYYGGKISRGAINE